MSSSTNGPWPIAAENIEKRYGDVVALRGVSVGVPARCAFGLVGPNGSGKSTLIGLLSGLTRPDSGRARLGGLDPCDDPAGAKQSFGCMPEYLPLFELLTGEEQLQWVGQLHGIPNGILIARVAELADALDLTSAIGRRISGYSKGMRHKLAFAAALIGDPRTIILDEPFEGVDVLAVQSMKAILRQFIDAGAAVLLSSHILPLVEDVCDRFGVISEGRIVFEGDRGELVREADRLASGAAAPGRSLESVFLGLVAPCRAPDRLKIVAIDGGR